MTFNWRVYIALVLIVAVSFSVAWLVSTTDFWQEILRLPGVVALIGAVFQIFRDQAEYDKKLLLQRDQQHFVLGATSPMAGVTFSKHVEFCEKYIARMQEGLAELFAEGPTNKALKFSSDLKDIRLSYRAWLTTDLQNKIMPFEEALIKIGSLSNVVANSQNTQNKMRAYDKVYEIFDKVTGLQIAGQGSDEKIAAGKIIEHLQDLLGVKQLIHLRTALIEQAMEMLERKG